jgi:hypothetical protein
MTETLHLTVGTASDGRELAIISTGGHPQIPGSGVCTVLTLELTANMPDGVDAWYEQMKRERPWETRQ